MVRTMYVQYYTLNAYIRTLYSFVRIFNVPVIKNIVPSGDVYMFSFMKNLPFYPEFFFYSASFFPIFVLPRCRKVNELENMCVNTMYT